MSLLELRVLIDGRLSYRDQGPSNFFNITQTERRRLGDRVSPPQVKSENAFFPQT